MKVAWDWLPELIVLVPLLFALTVIILTQRQQAKEDENNVR